MKARSIIYSLILLFLITGISYAEDPRWEGSSSRTDKVQLGVRKQVEEKISPEDAVKLQRTLNIMKEPPVPLRTPDKLLRVLFFPYIDENKVLHNYKYSFVKVEEGKFIIGDYLMEPAKRSRNVLHPVENSGGGQPAAKPAKEGKKK